MRKEPTVATDEFAPSAAERLAAAHAAALEAIAQDEAEAKAKAEAERAAQHKAAIAALSEDHTRVANALTQLGAQLRASVDKAEQDRDHLGYAQSFLRDVELMTAEKLDWIARHV